MITTVTHKQCDTIAMVEGGERRHPIIIDGNRVMQWVGFGWISLREATPDDRTKYPALLPG